MPVMTAPSAPAFQTGAPFLLILPLVIAVVVLAFVGGRGVSVFKKQGVAWGLTALMIVAAIGIGNIKAFAGSRTPEESPQPYVRDDAGVLSDRTLTLLTQRNQRLYGKYGVAIAVITCNYGGNELGSYVDKRGEEMNLGRRDFIVVLDVRGDDYWLGRGEDLARDFTNDDCIDYAWDYMEDYFAAGDYDSAVLSLTEMLEAWYGTYFG